MARAPGNRHEGVEPKERMSPNKQRPLPAAARTVRRTLPSTSNNIDNSLTTDMVPPSDVPLHSENTAPSAIGSLRTLENRGFGDSPCVTPFTQRSHPRVPLCEMNQGPPVVLLEADPPVPQMVTEHLPEAHADPDASDDSSSSSGDSGERSPDSRKRKVSGGLENQPRRTRRVREALASPPRGGRSSPEAEDFRPEFLVRIPRSPSPCSRSPDFKHCPSPPLVGPYSPPAPRQRRFSLSTPSSPVPQRMSAVSQPRVDVPVLAEADGRRLLEHEDWLQAQLQSFSTCTPNRSGASEPEAGDSDTSDDDAEPEVVVSSGPQGGTPAPAVNSKYFAQFYSRFEECKRLNHLPTLNLCFTLMETLLLLGNKKTLAVLLRKNNLPKLLAAMQYNPKLNHLLHCRPEYLDAMGQRRVALPLPTAVADLAVTLYQLLYLKDCLIPVVCDESRYLNFNVHVMRTKAKLCQMVFDDRRLLPQLFSDLRSGSLSLPSQLDYLRFLKEFLELGITSYPGDGAYFWRGILRDHQLVPLLTELLSSPDHMLRRRAIDVCLLLCDEESRKLLYGVLPQHPRFLRNLFEVFRDTASPEATVLQLQATLPMLVASPHVDTLPVFYEAAQQVLEGWTGTTRAGRGLPPHTHVSSFMELLSLAIHHHHRTFYFSHEGCVHALVDFASILWNDSPELPQSVLVAVNKGILSILHVSQEGFHKYLANRDVFRGMLRRFNDSNNLITSSMLTLLHTILQLEIRPLVEHICAVWFPAKGPALKSLCFVQQLFHERQKANSTGATLF